MEEARVERMVQALEALRRCPDIDCMQVGEYDVVYNPHGGEGGVYEVYVHDSDHTEYRSYANVHEAARVLAAQ